MAAQIDPEQTLAFAWQNSRNINPVSHLCRNRTPIPFSDY
jgi:hypothetical protein